MIALLYNIGVRTLTKTRVEVTLTPNRLGRLLRRRVRQGIAYKARDSNGYQAWWWSATDRHVGLHIERYIEAAPLLSLEDMSVEQLLLEAGAEESKGSKR